MEVNDYFRFFFCFIFILFSRILLLFFPKRIVELCLGPPICSLSFLGLPVSLVCSFTFCRFHVLYLFSPTCSLALFGLVISFLRGFSFRRGAGLGESMCHYSCLPCPRGRPLRRLYKYSGSKILFCPLPAGPMCFIAIESSSNQR